MIPSFTTVEWAIIVGGVVSSITLIFVFLDFYWSHIVTEKSDVSVRSSASRDSYISPLPEQYRVESLCTIANEGNRSAVVRASKADIRFEPSGTELPWEEMKEIVSDKKPSLKIKQIENNSISGDSTVEGTIEFSTHGIERLNSLIESQESITLDVVINVEDNEEHYQIDYSDKVELNDN